MIIDEADDIIFGYPKIIFDLIKTGETELCMFSATIGEISSYEDMFTNALKTNVFRHDDAAADSA